MQKEDYCLQMSGGRTSAMMTIECLRLPEYQDAIVSFQNTGKEDTRTLDFVHQVDEYLGGNRIIWLEYIAEKPGYKVVTYETASRNGEPFNAMIQKKRMLPNRIARFCTQDLKVLTNKKYLQKHVGWKHWTNLVGIRYDEPRRWSKSKSVEKKEVFCVEHPLVKMRVTKPIVLDYWKAMPFNLQIEEWEGNCDLCFLKGKKKKLTIARHHPERFDWWVKQEENNFQKGKAGLFNIRYTYAQLLNLSQTQPELFDEIDYDDSLECFCNID